MQGPWSPSGAEPLLRRARVRTLGELAAGLLARADAQQQKGIAPENRIRTGLRSVDELIPSWWGLTVLTGTTERDHLTLASRVALFTAGGTGRVFWMSLAGDPEAPVFRLLTGLASVPARSVFGERDLSAKHRASLATVYDEIASLPIQIADAHGLSLGECRAMCLEAQHEGAIDLIVVDGIEGLDDRLMGTLENLSEELGVAVLAVVTIPDETAGGMHVGAWPHPWPLLKGSLVLRVRRAPLAEGEPTGARGVPLWLDVALVGEDSYRESVELLLDPRCRWVDDYPVANLAEKPNSPSG